MADTPDAPLTGDQAAGMAQAHMVAAQEHVGHALGYLSDSSYSPDADAKADEESAEGDTRPDSPAEEADEPRGMARFTASSAQRRGGFPAGSGAARTMAAMTGRR